MFSAANKINPSSLSLLIAALWSPINHHRLLQHTPCAIPSLWTRTDRWTVRWRAIKDSCKQGVKNLRTFLGQLILRERILWKLLWMSMQMVVIVTMRWALLEGVYKYMRLACHPPYIVVHLLSGTKFRSRYDKRISLASLCVMSRAFLTIEFLFCYCHHCYSHIFLFLYLLIYCQWPAGDLGFIFKYNMFQLN